MNMNVYLSLLFAGIASLTNGDSNLQDWSDQVKEGIVHTITCQPTNVEREPMVYDNSSVQWYKHGLDSQLQNGTEFGQGRWLLSNNDLDLTIDPVNQHSAGIYFCKVKDASKMPQGNIVKGVNVNGPKRTGMDKYEDNIITGAVTAVAVFAIVCSGCFIDHFRYRSPEQKQKIEDRKQQLLAEQQGTEAGIDNPGLETGEDKPRHEDTHL